MKLKQVLLFGFIIMHSGAFCQTYVVDLEDRNKAVDLTNNAAAFIKEKKFSDAISSLTSAIAIDSTLHPAYLRLYEASMLSGSKSDTIITYLNKAKRIFLTDDEIRYYLGEVYRKRNELKSAIEEYSSAISCSKLTSETSGEGLSYVVPSCYFNRGTCYLKQNLVDSALLDYNDAIKLKPDYPYALLNRGICLYKKGNLAEACADWNRSLELGCLLAKEYIDKSCNKTM